MLPEVIIGLVLLGIALINFVNMLVVKTVSRKGEFAVYESLGMTRAQLRQLMLLEGGLHAAAMALVTASQTPREVMVAPVIALIVPPSLATLS